MNKTILNERYQLVKQLSTKPGRRIFMAQDLQSGNLVIVKILLFDPDFKWKEHELFEREAQTLKNLKHPAIPKYLDYFDVSTDNYHGFALVQTYIDAPSLELLIQDGRKFSENELVELANKILSILDYLHQQNPIIIHRDIKPSNILLTNRSGNSVGEIYLVDFGCVQTTASKEYGTITVVGTYGYISPEQFGGQAVPASDLYSLGMTIIYLVTGIHPAELPQVNGQYKVETPQLSKRFQKWLEKTIRLNLDQRFISAQVAQQSLMAKNSYLSNYSSLKPIRTKIELSYHDYCIEIIILKIEHPFRKKINDLIGHLYFALICSGFIYAFAMAFFPFLTPSITFLLIYFFILYIIPRDTSRKDIAKISIDDDKIFAFNKMNDLILDNFCSEISLLGYSPSYEFNQFFDNDGKRHNRGTVRTVPELFIYAGSNKYSIKNLSAEEFWWLGHELSAIFNLELNVIYPTPKVPPEPSSCACGC
ncbi:MAG: serine/threonine-protein kinase [Synechocystis sp.]|nr:serine/threonine-protein kinase [Synechocystis sp.]